MSVNDLMIHVAAADFNVGLIAKAGEAALFGALRKGGTQHFSNASGGVFRTHVMGVWHFVLMDSSLRNGIRFKTRQWHVPRFEMAQALWQQHQFFKSRQYASPSLATWMPIPTLVHGRQKLSFVIDGCEELPLNESFVKTMKKDLSLLGLARDWVKEGSSGYHIPLEKTAAGHPLESSSRRLLEAIAFEKLTVPRMSAENFGVYSAQCTYQDFDLPVGFPPSVVREILSLEIEYNLVSPNDEMCRLIDEVQRTLFAKSVWKFGVPVDLEAAVPVVADGIAKLTRVQRTQVVLMNGMHGAGLFLPLAAALGLCTFEQYAEWMCQGMAPDSPEEQQRRTESAYINLFGVLSD